MRFGPLLWVFFVHVAGIYLFVKGFLLKRIHIPDFSDCSSANCGVAATHNRAILLIIDALRFDFIAPNPNPPSPVHHGILKFPQELTAKYPNRSFIFNAYADPPTLTVQRVKALTTGSLPTVVDAGESFGGTSIAADSILNQLKLAGKKSALMGNDIWMFLFPDTFEEAHAYETLDVEDLDTVDGRVIGHLFSLLDNPSIDFLIGHFEGVDHAGHRVGPDHPSMMAKLEQMDNVLRRVVDRMSDDTLLVVVGDHGMDHSGSHGGDGVLETSAATWIYSKGPELTISNPDIPEGLLQFTTFPGADVPHRSIQQIDLVPTLSLLLGLPIPFSNLGNIIPELFWRGHEGEILAKSLQINTAQIMSYLDVYRANLPPGYELESFWGRIQAAKSQLMSSNPVDVLSFVDFNRAALSACRSIWAQFDLFLMALGLCLLSVGFCASWSLYSGCSRLDGDWNSWLSRRMLLAVKFSLPGVMFGAFTFYFPLATNVYGAAIFDCTLFTAFFGPSMELIVSSPPIVTLSAWRSTPFVMILHSLVFFSNHLTIWEDKIVLFLLITSIVPHTLAGISAPSKHLRHRIIGFSVLFALSARLISLSTVCREGQQPHCHSTFFASPSLTSPPRLVLYLALPTAVGLPYIIQHFLRLTKSDNGIASNFIGIFLAPALFGGCIYWIMEWADAMVLLGSEWTYTLRLGRTLVAGSSFGWILIGGGTSWWYAPLCLDGKVKHMGEEPEHYANAFGAPYLILWTITLSVVFITTQLTGQLVISAATIAFLSFLQVLDSVREVRKMEVGYSESKPSGCLRFSDIVPLSLLGIHTFHGTGHHATIASLQFKSAFLLTHTATFPFSPLTLLINTIGPVYLFALAAPLVVLWNDAPLLFKEKKTEVDDQLEKESTAAALGLIIYYSALLIGMAVSAVVFRRHQFMWNVIAPRFVFGVMELLAVDVAILFGLGVGVERSRAAQQVKRLGTGN